MLWSLSNIQSTDKNSFWRVQKGSFNLNDRFMRGSIRGTSVTRDSKRQHGCGAYVCQVSQLDLQVGLSCLGLGSHSHSNDLGVHNCVVPESNERCPNIRK